MKIGFLVFMMLNLCWGREPSKVAFVVGKMNPEALGFEKVKTKNSEFYLVIYKSRLHGNFTRAIPKSYFKASLRSFKAWDKKMLGLGPAYAAQNCREGMSSEVDGIRLNSCYEQLSATDKKAFNTWFKENETLAKLPYGKLKTKL